MGALIPKFHGQDRGPQFHWAHAPVKEGLNDPRLGFKDWKTHFQNVFGRFGWVLIDQTLDSAKTIGNRLLLSPGGRSTYSGKLGTPSALRSHSSRV